MGYQESLIYIQPQEQVLLCEKNEKSLHEE